VHIKAYTIHVKISIINSKYMQGLRTMKKDIVATSCNQQSKWPKTEINRRRFNIEVHNLQ
jgi:hypothetical protein